MNYCVAIIGGGGEPRGFNFDVKRLGFDRELN